MCDTLDKMAIGMTNDDKLYKILECKYMKAIKHIKRLESVVEDVFMCAKQRDDKLGYEYDVHIFAKRILEKIPFDLLPMSLQKALIDKE